MTIMPLTYILVTYLLVCLIMDVTNCGNDYDGVCPLGDCSV